MTKQRKLTPHELANLTGDLLPEEDNKFSLGNASKQIKNAKVAGTATIAVATIADADITKGAIDAVWMSNKVSKTNTYTALITDQIILVDTTSGFTIYLPAVATAEGKTLTFIKTDSAGNALKLDGNAAETIDGNTTYTGIDAQHDTVTLYCDGTAWYIIGKKVA